MAVCDCGPGAHRNQRTCGDIPFPGVAQGQHAVMAAFGDKAQAVGKRCAKAAFHVGHAAGPVLGGKVGGRGQQGGTFDFGLQAGTDRLAILQRGAGCGCGIKAVEGGKVDHACDHRAVFRDGQRMGERLFPRHECPGAVDRVDDELAGGGQAGGGVCVFFGQPAVVWAGGAQGIAQHGVDGQISLGHRAGAVWFFPGLGRLPPEPQGNVACGTGGVGQQGQIMRRQGSCLRPAGWARAWTGARGRHWRG